MREILFKAKREDNNEWIEGYYWTNLMNNHFIRIAKDKNEKFTIEDYEIIPETLCQYTGITDQYGNRIWDNDIVYINSLDEKYIILWNKRELEYVLMNNGYQVSLGRHFYGKELKVIGNTFDNPKLLEVEE